MKRDDIAAGRQAVQALREAMPDAAARRALDRALAPWLGVALYLPRQTPQEAEGVRLAARNLVEAKVPSAVRILRRRFGVSERTARRRLAEARAVLDVQKVGQTLRD